MRNKGKNRTKADKEGRKEEGKEKKKEDYVYVDNVV